METGQKWIGACGLALALATPLAAQMTRQQAVAGMRKVDAKEMDPTYTKAAPAAQKLVNEILARHPEVILLGIHAQPPGHRNVIVASNFDRIGKLGDEDDMRVIHTGKSNFEVPPTADRYEVEFPLRDRGGKIIGCVGVVFNYKPGQDKAALNKIAGNIAAEMRAHLPDESSLFN